jgi:hypothetical protein
MKAMPAGGDSLPNRDGRLQIGCTSSDDSKTEGGDKKGGSHGSRNVAES